MTTDSFLASLAEVDAAVEQVSVALPDAGERIELPSGARLFYFDADHSYWRCKDDGSRGRRLTGVTTVAKTLDHDPSRLLSWAAKTQMIGVAELARSTEDRAWLESEETIWQALQDARLTFEHVRNRAATRGTNVHQRVFEALCRAEAVNLRAMAEEERGYAEGVIRFWNDESPQPILVEQVVYSERLGIAGRLDFYGRIQSREGVGVVDVKTSGFLGAAAHAQVGGGYPLLLEESGWPASEWSVMLQVADGGYTLVEAEGTPGSFEVAVACYRAAGKINAAANRARKAREG